MIEPLSTIQSIQEAVKQDPSLRVSLAKKYQGLGGTLSNNAIPLPADQTETKEPLAIFSRDGKVTVEEAKNKVASFVPKEEKETAEPIKPTPETKGGLTFDEAIQLFGQDFTGLQQQPDGTYVPDKSALERMGITSKKTKEETALEESKIELENVKKQISGLLIPDEEVQRQVNAISAQWDARANEMADINRRREAALTTTGLRLGSQYTGGLRGGVFGSIISEEERQGLSRIQDLEAKKQEAILAAKKAQRENNYTVLVKQADLLEKSYNEQLDEIKELNKLQADKAKELREEKEKLTKGDSVYNAYASGITDATKIYEKLRNDGVEITPKEVDEILEIFTPTKEKLNLRSLQGGLYDVTNDKWIIEPPEKIEPKAKEVILDKLTWTEAIKRKLPLELVGMSEIEIINQINSNIPANWFRKMIEEKRLMTLNPEELMREWLIFKDNIFEQETSSETSIEDI